MSEENTNKVEQAAETAGEAAGAAQEAVDVVEGEVSDSVAEATASVAEAVEATDEALEAAAEAAEAVVPAIETTSVADAAVEAVAAQEAAHEALDAAVATAEAAEAAAEAVAETDAPAEVVEAAEAAAEAAQEVAEAANEAVVEVSNLTVGYTGELTGRVYTYADLEQEPDDEEEQLDEELMSLYESSLTEIAESEIVEGRVVRISDKDVVIDIGFKSDGIVARNEFPAEIEAGDEVEVYVERVEDRHGQLILSKRRADDLRRWQRIEDAFENEGVLEGDIVNRIKGGMVVDLFGTEAFLPGSQIDIRPVRDFDAYLGKRMEFKVVKINPINGNVVVSHKALIEKDLEEQRAQILSQMEAGQVLEGIVKNITDFGVFIDLGGVDGLLHITDLSWGRVGHPSELVELDQKMKVVVLDYDKERKRISLGLKQLQPHPWENIDEKFVENMEVEGRVVSITDYGAFVELEKGIEGLVHISEMSWTKHVKHPTEMVKMGETVKVKILNIDQEGRKISLGMKQLRPDPWSNLSDRFPVGTTTRGIVRNITNFGVFVELEPGVDGLVHISDLSWTKKIRHPGEVVKKGQEMDVVVLNVDEGNRRLSLGHKQIETDPWNQFSVAYAEGTDVDVKIIRFAENGVVVELPLEVEAFVPASHLSNNQGDIQSAYNVGDTIETRVIEFNSGDRKIIVSERAKHDQEVRAARNAERQEKQARRTRERKEVESYQRRSTSSGGATLGELSGLAELKAKMEQAEAEDE